MSKRPSVAILLQVGKSLDDLSHDSCMYTRPNFVFQKSNFTFKRFLR